MTDTVILVDGISDMDEIIHDHDLGTSSKIFSLNFKSHMMLEKNKISHYMGEDFLTDEDKKLIDEKIVSTTVNWGDDPSMKTLTTFDGINLSSLLEIEILSFFVPIYMSAVTILRIIENENPKEVIMSTYLNDYAKRICESKGIQAITYGKGEQPSLWFDKINIKFNVGPLPISIYVSRRTYIHIKNFVENSIYSIFKLKPDSEQAKKKTILLLDFNPANYDVLIKELSYLDKNILLLNQRRPAVWNMKSFQIMKHSKCKIIILDQYEKKIMNKINSALNDLSVNLNKLWTLDHIFEKVFSIDSHTFWYSIKNSFMEICNFRFKESVKRILLSNEFFDEFNISVILEWAETGQEEKTFLHVAKRKRIKSVMLPHARYPISKTWEPYARFLGYFSYPSISDKQIVWGELTRDYAISHGYKKDNLLMIGSPRHDNFFNFNKDVKQKKGIVLFAPTGVDGLLAENSTTRAHLKFHDFTKEVCRVVKELPDKQLVVKPHPQTDAFTNTIKIIKEIDPKIPIILNADLPQLIDSCDMLITFTNSTISLESMIMNKPTISLQIAKWAEDDEIAKMGAVLSIREINEIEEGIKKILYNVKFRDSLLANAQIFLKKYMSHEGNSSKTLAKILDEF